MDLNRTLFKKIFYLTLKIRREWFVPTLKQLETTQYWSKPAFERLQLNKLNQILAHAHDHIPYYKGRIPRRLASLSQLGQLPLLEKEDIRSQADDFMWDGSLFRRLKTTGGSTGAPVTLLKDSRGMTQEMAARWRGYGWAGVKIGDRQARFWGVPRKKKERWRAELIDFISNRRRIAAFGYDEDYFNQALKQLRSFKPDYFYGYVSILDEFADHIISSGQQLGFPKTAIITTAEALTSFGRKKLENTFNTRVYNEYGCGELGTIAHECEEGSLHLNAENIVMEIISEAGEPVEPGESGEIVVTDLSNYSMPLIRYRLRDFGSLGGTSCACGRVLPVLKSIHGRQYDSLVNRQGRKFHGEFFLYIVEDAKKMGYAVDGVQFIQDQNLKIHVLLVCQEHVFSEIKRIVARRISEDFDNGIGVEFQRVRYIPREASGKLRVVKRLTG